MEEKKLKVIYVYDTHLSKRWLQNFCLDEMNDIFDIEYWDCASIVEIEYKTKIIIPRPYVVTINSLKDLETNLKRLPKDTLMVNGIHASLEDLKIHKILSRHIKNSIRVYCFSADKVTEFVYKNTIGSKMRKVASIHVFERICHKIRWKWASHLYKNMYKDYSIASLRSEEYNYHINHPDYERYRCALKQKTEFEGQRYVVYIDNQFPNHNDIIGRERNFDPVKMAPKFYASLNRFFDRVEERYNCKVKIAGHPIAQYKENPYGGREILYDKTVELVKEALAVCIHTSNAFSYVVLFDKPVALLYNSVYTQAKIEYGRLQGESQKLHLPLVNTDDPLPAEGSVFTKLDKDIAENYKSTYLIAFPAETNAELYIKIFHQIYDDWQKSKMR